MAICPCAQRPAWILHFTAFAFDTRRDERNAFSHGAPSCERPNPSCQVEALRLGRDGANQELAGIRVVAGQRRRALCVAKWQVAPSPEPRRKSLAAAERGRA